MTDREPLRLDCSIIFQTGRPLLRQLLDAPLHFPELVRRQSDADHCHGKAEHADEENQCFRFQFDHFRAPIRLSTLK